VANGWLKSEAVSSLARNPTNESNANIERPTSNIEVKTWTASVLSASSFGFWAFVIHSGIRVSGLSLDPHCLGI
jgi:hypothetical protein